MDVHDFFGEKFRYIVFLGQLLSQKNNFILSNPIWSFKLEI